MSDYFEETNCLGNSSTKPAKNTEAKKIKDNVLINIDYKYYSDNKPSKKIIGHVKKQD